MTALAFEVAMSLRVPWSVDERWIFAGFLVNAFHREPGWALFLLAEA